MNLAQAAHRRRLELANSARRHQSRAVNAMASNEDLRDVRDAAARIAIHGDRYPEHLHWRVGQ